EHATGDQHEHHEDRTTRFYRKWMSKLVVSRKRSLIFFGVVALALVASLALVGIGWVKVKMLPFDNKNEFQVIINMPEGSSLERTVEASREIAQAISVEPEVVNYQIYAGTSSPFNFNGLVRHYFLRRGEHVADIQVNLLPKGDRSAQSHDIARRVRPKVHEIAQRFAARVAVAEVPPGPPVLQTLVAEIYGPTDSSRVQLAREIRKIFDSTKGVVDVDTYLEDDQRKLTFEVDHEKAALHGISADQIAQTLRVAVSGMQVDIAHRRQEREDIGLVVELPRSRKTSYSDLLNLRLRSPHGELVPLSELVTVKEEIVDKTIYRKNLMPVTYVIGDVAGEIESPVYAIEAMNKKIAALNARTFGGTQSKLKVYNASMPFTDLEPSMKWDGEWHITIEVFRDLGLAFAAVLVLIYILLVGWFRSMVTPIILMVVIPLSLIGILPAHGAMNAFFTATSMIGFMAGAGIVIRNSIILIDFAELRLSEGSSLADAVIDAGAVRFRPILLTAGAVVVGAGIILFDPIFQGLAIALIAGEVASLIISPVAVPLLYYMVNRKRLSARPQTAPATDSESTGA
ncbi:multidrug transporter AcrB, partial [candidate division GN15 bacterium]